MAATAVMNTYDRMRLDGKDQDIQVIGTDEFYKPVRNMVVLSGRFLDASDVALRQKVGVLTEKLAKRLEEIRRQIEQRRPVRGRQ